MKVGKIFKVGDSNAIVIPTSHMRRLGWFKGDYVAQAIEDGQLVLRNMRAPVLHPILTRKEYGDGKRG